MHKEKLSRTPLLVPWIIEFCKVADPQIEESNPMTIINMGLVVLVPQALVAPEGT
jgi:hypothetical protein